MEVAVRPSLLWVLGLSVMGCADDGSGTENYESRILAAEARATDALCACSWSERLRDQCLLYRESAHDGCTAELSAQLANQQPSYVACIARQTELHARCLEETDCDTRISNCRLDVRLDCGPAPDNLEPALGVCLPTFRCNIGQEVSLDRRCDDQPDCFDSSDEEGCP